MIEIKCENCGKLFFREKYRVKKDKLNFCEYSCYNEFLKHSTFFSDLRVRYNDQIIDGKALCTICGSYKEFSEFHKNKKCVHRNGYSYCCKECDLKRAIYNPVKSKASVVKSMSNPRNFINALIGKSKKRKTSELGNNINIDYCMMLYEKQNGKCAISNQEMTFCRGVGSVDTNLSIDRIDSSIGYVEGNIQFVCNIINTMKTNLSMNDFVKWCNLIVKNNE